MDPIVYRHEVALRHNPRGPRSRPGFAVPVRHHLIDPIRPTRRHIAISPLSGLYAMPSLCGSADATREWSRAFAGYSFLTCHPLRPREVRHRTVQFFTTPTRSSPRANWLDTSDIPQSDSRGAPISGLTNSPLLRPVGLLASPCRIRPDWIPAHRRLLHPGFRTGRSPFPPLDMTTTSTGLLCRRDLHPLEQQLASLH